MNLDRSCYSCKHSWVCEINRNIHKIVEGHALLEKPRVKIAKCPGDSTEIFDAIANCCLTFAKMSKTEYRRKLVGIKY